MVDLLLTAYLLAPALFGLAAFLYAVTRATDRIQLATGCLFVCTLLYSTLAYEMTKRQGSTQVIGVALAAYASFLYVATAALAIYFKAWAWRVAVVAFGLHLLAGLVGSPSALGKGAQGLALLLVFLAVGAIGLWASLHKGTRNALSTTPRRTEA